MITMKDIAVRAGVSRPTVSAVLNPRKTSIRIGPETRKRILQIAAEMGYLPNENARSVRVGYTKIIGVIGNSTGSFAAQIFRGIAKEIQQSGYSMKLVIPDEDEGFENAVLRCAEQRVCGIIFFASDQSVTAEVWQMTERYQIPAVLLSSNEGDLPGCRVSSDDEDGVGQAVRHFRQLGHSRIGFASVRSHDHYQYSIRRRNGFYQAMGADADPALDFHLPVQDERDGSTLESGIDNTAILNAVQQKQLTAIFCASDYIAASLLRSLITSGVRVPQDVSVAGFGDINYARLLVPALTTISQPFQEMGHAAVVRLLQLIRNPEEISHVILPTRLIIRETTAEL